MCLVKLIHARLIADKYFLRHRRWNPTTTFAFQHGLQVRAQYGIDLPGTDVVEKVNFLVAASKHGSTSVAEGSP